MLGGPETAWYCFCKLVLLFMVDIDELLHLRILFVLALYRVVSNLGYYHFVVLFVSGCERYTAVERFRRLSDPGINKSSQKTPNY